MVNRWLGGMFLLLVLSGCGAGMATISSINMPDADLGSIRTVYVQKLPADERKLNQMIVDELSRKGFKASTEPGGQPTGPLDARIEYKDRWFWDMTMYMYQLTIYVKDKNGEHVLGAGKSFRMSLARKDPEFMIREVLDAILGSKK